jgi:PadR family transcriptional regulator, regulatory protein AphA
MDMVKSMSLPHAIMGLLNIMPMTGYELKKFFDDSIGFFWSAQMSQIYRELKTLEINGDVSSKEELSKKGPSKKIYKVTKQGVIHLKEWLEDIPDKFKRRCMNESMIFQRILC